MSPPKLNQSENWRQHLRRDIGWLLAAKLGLLAVLWALFFSGSHRCRVDGPAAANRLAVVGTGLPAATPGGDRCD